MTSSSAGDLLTDGFERVRGGVHRVLDGMDERALTFRVDREANTVAWLVWHLTRVQDDHITGIAGGGQVWIGQGWEQRFGLPFDADATGYGHSSADVGAVRASADLLAGYHDAVADRTIEYLRSLEDGHLSRVVDEDWDPPVTLGVRLMSILSDDLQHVGQAAFVKGIAGR